MSETPNSEYIPGMESLQDKEAFEQESTAFKDAGWEMFNPAQAFYDLPGEEGDKMTLAEQATDFPERTNEVGMGYWQIKGDVEPPDGTWKKRKVYQYDSKNVTWDLIQTDES